MTVGEPFRGLLQAHWYQWDGFYIVLYRGFDASDGTEICAGNSIQSMGSFVNVSNSPHLGATNEICVGVSSLTLALPLALALTLARTLALPLALAPALTLARTLALTLTLPLTLPLSLPLTLPLSLLSSPRVCAGAGDRPRWARPGGGGAIRS